MKANHKTYVQSLSVDELFEKEMELENIAYADGGLDEDILMDIYELQFAIAEELASRGIVDARDYEEYDAWQGCEEPEDYPPDEDFEPTAYEAPVASDITREEYLDWLEEKQAIEGPVEWF